jgi:hypothetical protein
LYAIYCLDNPDSGDRRAANYPAHYAYLAKAAELGVKIVMAGPLTEDDGSEPIGSLFLVEARDRATVLAFHKGDPFVTAGVWRQASINAYKAWRA